MLLYFRPRDPKFIGAGTLPHGSFDDTSKWLPITRYLEKGAEMFPEKVMFRVGDRDGNLTESYSYKETNEWANRVANGLRKRFRIKKGDKVGIYMINCSEYVISIIGIHKSGAVQVPINKDEKGERLAYVINYSDMKALVIDPDSLLLLQEIATDLTKIETIFMTGDPRAVPDEISGIKALPFSTFNEFSSDNLGLDVTIADMERCMFTSGTTGMPKGVARDHGGVILTVRVLYSSTACGIRCFDDVLVGHTHAR
jgi:acyl-CoA synthetase (AMP-forming)/AMP-acid ligase II